MRRIAVCLTLLFCCLAPALSLAQQTAAQPALPDVLEYIRLFGYREMLELSAERQLEVIIALTRQERPDVSAETFTVIQEELRTELHTASERSIIEMAEVFQRHFTREDIAYLLSVGRDPRMQRVVRLQPQLARDMEGIGERLADDISEKAAPRIEQRLRQLTDAPKS